MQSSFAKTMLVLLWVAAVLGFNQANAIDYPTKPLKLVFGYPRDWILALAHDLAQRCPVTEATTLNVPSVLPVDVNEDPGERKTSRRWQHSRNTCASRL